MKMRWAGNVASKRKMEIEYKILIIKPEGKRHLSQDPGIILKWILRTYVHGAWVVLTWVKDDGRWQVLVNTVMNLRVP
jgi:hypothetical protein